MLTVHSNGKSVTAKLLFRHLLMYRCAAIRNTPTPQNAKADLWVQLICVNIFFSLFIHKTVDKRVNSNEQFVMCSPLVFHIPKLEGRFPLSP